MVDANAASDTRAVVVTIDTECCLPPTLDLAISLAAASQCKLHGLFVEDLNLLRVAGLPFTREVTLSGGVPRNLDHKQVLRSLKARSREFRRLLEIQAKQSSLAWSYSTLRTRRRSMELGEYSHAEFLVFGQSALRRPGGVKPNRILALGHDSPYLRQALGVVLAAYPGRPIELLVLDLTESDYLAKWRSWLANSSSHPGSKLATISQQQLSAAVAGGMLAVDYVIASRQSLPAIQLQLLQSVNCPVIITP